jgi:lipopolysaccharide/colanic/teichoic acid biosynthesis glycosyltransferase
MQRAFDLIFSIAALLLLSPLLLPISIILRLSGEGEVFFLQQRIGRGGRPFGLFKFATMLKNSPNSGTVTVKNDPRILPVGRFLRKTKINELPQLLNVVRGEMSLIGPRPLTSQTFTAYAPQSQNAIKQVRPGLSGIGSIVFRGEEDLLSGAASSFQFYCDQIAPYKGSLEEWYVGNQGLKTYFLAIAVTIWVVLAPKSRIVWRAFPDLPTPPPGLQSALGYLSPDGQSSTA